MLEPERDGITPVREPPSMATLLSRDPVFKRGAWAHCALTFDTPSQTYQVEIDGKRVHGKIPFLTEACEIATWLI